MSLRYRKPAGRFTEPTLNTTVTEVHVKIADDDDWQPESTGGSRPSGRSVAGRAWRLRLGDEVPAGGPAVLGGHLGRLGVDSPSWTLIASSSHME